MTILPEKVGINVMHHILIVIHLGVVIVQIQSKTQMLR